jgi:hypothetical protein
VGDAHAAGFEWFIGTARMRRTHQSSSKRVSYVEEPEGSSPVSSLKRFDTPKSVNNDQLLN